MLNIYIEVTGDSEQFKYQVAIEDLDLPADKVVELGPTARRTASKIMDLVQS